MSDQLLDRQKTQWIRELKTHELVVDEAILPKVIKAIPLSEEEITQAAIELKAGAKDTLNEEVVLEAARKVLADNVIMARKGSAALKSQEPVYCTIGGPTSTSQYSVCIACGPSSSNNPALFTLQCAPCAPNRPMIGGPGGGVCPVCGPHNYGNFAQPQCSAVFSNQGCIAAFDPIPDWGRPDDLAQQVSNLQLQALQEKLAGR